MTPSLSSFFRVFIFAGLGLKTAVITAAFHPLIGVVVGAVVGYATLSFGAGQKERK